MRCRGRRLLLTPGDLVAAGDRPRRLPCRVSPPGPLRIATERCGATTGTRPWHTQEGRGRSPPWPSCPHNVPLSPQPPRSPPAPASVSLCWDPGRGCPRGAPNPKPARPVGTSQYWGHPGSPQLWPGHGAEGAGGSATRCPPSHQQPRGRRPEPWDSPCHGVPYPHRDTSGLPLSPSQWGSSCPQDMGQPPFSTARGRLCCCVSPKLWGGGI